ncbi:alkaline phosphatase family protein [Archangium sp.]|uniref:alkaline phosphatase family protein n=1 Tax=Archangium sp. TaxID=1872627 RepID=UPI002ED784B2
MLLALSGLLACGRAEAETPPASARRESASSKRHADPKREIKHVVVVMMENRSFDHLVGWTPGADGRQDGLAYPDRQGTLRPTYPLAPDYQGCAHPDPDHSYVGGRVEYNGGASDGWLLAGTNDEYAIGYYRQAELPFLGQAVPRWTTFDRYFSSIMAETYPNRIYQHAAQTDRITNTFELSTLPTIWDRLAEKGISGRYYYSDVPFLALWGPKYLPISRPLAVFLAEAATGTLPQVSFVDPRFLVEEQGTSGDDHPHGDIRDGEAFLNLVYTAVTQGPGWKNTVLIINFDEWGGFYDHVPPPVAEIPPADRLAGNEDGRLGFRTPALLIAPWAKSGAVSHTQFDHTSVLRFIEWRWDLEPLTVRDATANNLVEALDFTQTPRRAPLFLVPPGPYGRPCALSPFPPDNDLEKLEEIARQQGWPVYRSR